MTQPISDVETNGLLLITESRAQRVSKSLEKDPVFAKRLGPKTVEIPKKGGGVTLHYQATIDIVTAMQGAKIEVADATKSQLLAYSCDYFKLTRPASLADENPVPVSIPATTPTPAIVTPAPAPPVQAVPVKTPEVVKPPIPPAPAPSQAVAEKKPKSMTVVSAVPPAPKVTKPKPTPAPSQPLMAKTPPKTCAEVSKATDTQARLSEGTIDGPPDLAIYILLLSCIQLAKVDKKKGTEDRSKSLDRIAREYGRIVGAK